MEEILLFILRSRLLWELVCGYMFFLYIKKDASYLLQCRKQLQVAVFGFFPYNILEILSVRMNDRRSG